MKRITDLAAVILAILLFLVSTGCYLLENPHKEIRNKKTDIPEKAIKSFEQGITSNNDGLKKSAIYLAGAYKIEQLVEPLVKQFSKENDENIKFLIALALYTIGDKNGVAAVKEWQNNRK